MQGPQYDDDLIYAFHSPITVAALRCIRSCGHGVQDGARIVQRMQIRSPAHHLGTAGGKRREAPH
jgi:hypothetical protein